LQPQIVGYHDHEQTRGFVRCQRLWRGTLQCFTVAIAMPFARRKLATATNIRLAFVFETTTKKLFKVTDAIVGGLEKLRANVKCMC
jgi:hypothetical protein